MVDKFKQIVDIFDDSILILNKNTHVIEYANQQFFNLFGQRLINNDLLNNKIFKINE